VRGWACAFVALVLATGQAASPSAEAGEAEAGFLDVFGARVWHAAGMDVSPALWCGLAALR